MAWCDNQPRALATLQADVERDFVGKAFGLKTFPTIVLLPQGQVRCVCFVAVARLPLTRRCRKCASM